VTVAAAPRRLGPRIDGRMLFGPGRRIAQVVDPYRCEPVAEVTLSRAADVTAAVRGAALAQPGCAAMPVHRRAAALRRIAEELEQHAPRLAESITRQTGKVIKDTLREARRAPWTFRAAASAIEAMAGELPPASAMPGGEGLLAMAQRVPVGVVAAITPFNAPLNLTAHKLAPALAAGNAVVLKPAPAAPATSYDLADLIEASGFPPGVVNVVPGGGDIARRLARHPDVGLVSFTGGVDAGRQVLAAAGLRRVLLELGGNSPNIVHCDAHLESAAQACLNGGFRNAGQSCNSVQRILVHKTVAEPFVALLADRAQTLRVGDPLDPATDVGPVVNETAACRIGDLLDEAVAGGARVVTGGSRDGVTVNPTVLVRGATPIRLDREEAFAPLVLVSVYEDLADAIARANDTRFGLQSAVFTSSLDVAMRAVQGLRAGAVLVNRSTNFRLDHLPYGGVGCSGLGREGPRSALEEMTELRLAVLAPADPSGWGN
jgi:acyl-CoA reductase-like NAD-dependent aldehyde dehydrogenase